MGSEAGKQKNNFSFLFYSNVEKIIIGDVGIRIPVLVENIIEIEYLKKENILYFNFMKPDLNNHLKKDLNRLISFLVQLFILIDDILLILPSLISKQNVFYIENFKGEIFKFILFLSKCLFYFKNRNLILGVKSNEKENIYN